MLGDCCAGRRHVCDSIEKCTSVLLLPPSDRISTLIIKICYGMEDTVLLLKYSKKKKKKKEATLTAAEK